MKMNKLEEKWVGIIKELLEDAALKPLYIFRDGPAIAIYVSNKFNLYLRNFDCDIAEIVCTNHMLKTKIVSQVFFIRVLKHHVRLDPKESLRAWIWLSCEDLVRKYILLDHRIDLRIEVLLHYEVGDILEDNPKKEAEACLTIREFERNSSGPSYCYFFFEQDDLAIARAFIFGDTPESVFWEYVCEKDPILDNRINFNLTMVEKFFSESQC